MCRSVVHQVKGVVALCLLLGAIGCGGTNVGSGPTGASTTGEIAGPGLYAPAPSVTPGQDGSEGYGRIISTADELQRSLTFDLTLPASTIPGAVTEFRLLGDEVATDANSAYMQFGERMGMYQARESSDSFARGRVYDIGRGGQAAIDDRYVRRVTVRGCDGYVWDAVDIPALTDPGGAFRPGITVAYAGLVWSEGSRLFLLHGLAIDGEQLMQVAESLR